MYTSACVENRQKPKIKKLIIVGFIFKKKEKENDQSVKEAPAKELKQECYGMKRDKNQRKSIARGDHNSQEEFPK